MDSVEIKRARGTLGLSQQKMADVLGVHLMTYIKWEYGDRAVSAAVEQAVKNLVWLKTRYPGVYKAHLKDRGLRDG